MCVGMGEHKHHIPGMGLDDPKKGWDQNDWMVSGYHGYYHYCRTSPPRGGRTGRADYGYAFQKAS
jgi:hypothetical protein